MSYKIYQGEYIGPNPKDFEGSPANLFLSGSVVGADLFYWYRSAPTVPYPSSTFAYIPIFLGKYNWKEEDWWEYEINQMIDSGIDIIFLHYSYATEETGFATAGLKILDGLLKRVIGKTPRFSLFFGFQESTTGLDLTTEEGFKRTWFLIRNFYSRINPKYWARINGKVLIMIYQSLSSGKFTTKVFERIKDKFRETFGGLEVIFIGSTGWKINGKFILDWIHKWGAALSGADLTLDVVRVGPGFRHCGVDRRDRENGEFYSREWTKIIQSAKVPKLIVIETWNEWFEGTQIEDSKELGNLYKSLTNRFINDYKYANRFGLVKV